MHIPLRARGSRTSALARAFATAGLGCWLAACGAGGSPGGGGAGDAGPDDAARAPVAPPVPVAAQTVDASRETGGANVPEPAAPIPTSPAPAPQPSPVEPSPVEPPTTDRDAPEPVPVPEPSPEPVAAPRLEVPDALDATVGRDLRFVVSAAGAGTDVPSVTLADAPAGAVLADLDDGTREFRWTPAAGDVGERYATFEARPAGADAPDGVAAQASVLLRVAPATPPAPEPAPEPEPEPAASGAFDDGPSLRALAARHGLRIGSAALQNKDHDLFTIPDGERYREILATEYDILTPENALKLSEVQPERGTFDWEAADRVVEFAEANDMAVHGHPLLWHQQMPEWAEALGEASRREEMRAAMAEHVGAVVSRYAGRVAVWDVVNESLEEDGSLRHTPWYRGVGEDYLHEAFTLARAADPAASLIYNDYGIGWENPKSNALHERLRAELERGTPIDGVGFQLHLVTEFTIFDSVRRNFQRFADLGLDLWITELDVATDWRLDPAAEAERQARVYAAVVRLCVEQPRCKGLQVWGLSDRYAWRGSVEALPLDGEMAPKPAYFAMREALADGPAVPRSAPR